jgi:hypothetical protein
MQAAFISYAIFLALLLLAAIVVVIIVAVRTFLAHIRDSRGDGGSVSRDERPSC